MQSSPRVSVARAYPADGHAKRGPLPGAAPEMARATEARLRPTPPVVHVPADSPRPADEAPDAKPKIVSSNRLFGWLVGVGLALLLALLAALLFNAGINVEVVP